MSAVDERVVKMRFDNATFKQEAVNTQKALDNVNKAVDSSGKSRGLLDLGKQMEGVSVKASAMQVATVTAIATIANKAVDLGLKVAKSLTIDPIKAGFDEYELKMKSIQTILANTKGENLTTVSAALNKLNAYSDKTIYNFANMTENIGKMTTAGIGLQEATDTVKGFSNMAALAGGDANAAAGAMEQFSQGLQAGSIKAMDWMSLSNRGLGSQALQKAFFETARVAGTLTDVPVGQTFEDWQEKSGGFRASLESGWLTSDVAVQALTNMNGEVKNVKELMKQGFSRKAAEDMLEIADNAFESATKVRTFSAFMGTLKEQVGSGFAQVFEQLIGNFNQATNLFSRMSNATGKILGNIFTYISKLAQGWREMGGRAAILKTIKNILAPIGAILSVIAKAWTAAFGRREAGSGLASLSKGLRNITKPLQILADLINGSVGPITTVFRLFKIGGTVVKELAGFVGDLVAKLFGLSNFDMGGGGGGFLDFIKDFLKQVSDAIKKVSNLIDKGKSLKEAFSKVKFDMPDLPDFNVPSMPSFSAPSVDTGGVTGKFGLMTAGLKDLTNQMGIFEGTKFDTSNITSGADSATDSLNNTQDSAATLGDKIGPVIGRVKDAIVGFVKNINFDDLMASFNLAVLSTFVISMARMFNTMSKSFEAFIGTGEAVNGILDQAGNALKSFQTQARAKLLIAIAIAIGILALSLWLLSRIPADKLAKGLGALAGLAVILKMTMGALTATVESMEKKGTGLKMLALGATMVLFAISLSILASAMKKLNDVDWGSVVKAGVAMWALMKSMEALAAMKSEGILKTAFALVVVSAGLMLFAQAVKMFAKLDLAQFAEGMTYAAISLGTLVFMLKGFESSLGGAAAMVVAVGALWLMVGVIKKFAALDWGAFAKGMIMIAGALTVLVLTLYMFEASLAGAAALVVAVGALWLMVDVISAFASLDWSTFGKGLAMFAITMVTLGAIMALMGVFSPLILLGAAAILLFGAAIFLLGTGILFLAKGMGALILIAGGVVAAISAFAVGAAVGIGIFLQTLALQAPIMKDSILKILQALIDTIVGAVPMIIKGIKDLWNAVMKELGGDKGGGAKGAAMQSAGKGWMDKLKDGIKGMMPKIVSTAVELLVQFAEGLSNNSDKLAAAGVTFIVNILNGIARKMGEITAAGANLVISFLEGLEDAWSNIITRAITLMGEFLHDLADAIRMSRSVIGAGLTDVRNAMVEVGVDMVMGLIEGVRSMFSNATGVIGDLAGDMISKAKDMFKIFSPSRVFKDIGKFVAVGLTQGIQDHAAAAITAVASMVGGQIAVATEYISKFIQKLDQEALAATATATGLQKAAEKAAAAAEKTKKNKKDDKAAKQLQKKADKATRRAEKLEAKAEEAKARRERADQFDDASLIEKAQMRSEDAQNQMDDAKSAEFLAASKLAEAKALREQAKKKGVSDKDAKKMRAQADELEKQAANQARQANTLIEKARQSAKDALSYQKRAGDEAAALFQEEFDAEAKADAQEEAYNKMTDAEKAVERRRQAAELQAKANRDLQKAKELAYTDLEAANELAQQAMDEADQARAYLVDAAGLEAAVAQAAMEGSGQSEAETGGTVVNLDPTTAAAIAFGNYSDLFDAGVAAAAGGSTVEFNQYNTSPEALNPTDVYRHTNNQLANAADKLVPAA